jgi:hypothetical protein
MTTVKVATRLPPIERSELQASGNLVARAFRQLRVRMAMQWQPGCQRKGESR